MAAEELRVVVGAGDYDQVAAAVGCGAVHPLLSAAADALPIVLISPYSRVEALRFNGVAIWPSSASDARDPQ